MTMPTKEELKNMLELASFYAKRRDDYFLAFGRFIEQFSSAELGLFFLLSKHAKVSPPIAKAIFSGVKGEQGIKFIKRIWQVDKTPMLIRSELTAVFTQFLAINEVRNIIVHHGTREDRMSGERIASDKIIAHIPSRIRMHNVSVEKLHAMTLDLQKITQHFISLISHPRTQKQKRAKTYPYLLDAWQYRPQPVRRRLQKKRKKTGRKKA